MKNQVLSIEQMQRLKSLGVDTWKASMYWVYPQHPEMITYLRVVGIHGNLKAYEEANFGIGAFTLQDILEILPFGICDDHNGAYYLKAVKNSMGNWRYLYRFGYDIINNECHAKSNIEAAYETLIWVVENGYLKGGKQ